MVYNKRMDFSVLTYNTLYNQALKKIKNVLLESFVDILCFQEIETKEETFDQIEKLGFKLANYSNSFIKFNKIYGIATFYNPKTIVLNNSNIFNLPRSFYEKLLQLLRNKNVSRTVLKTNFIHKSKKKKFTVYNLHLTSWGTNGVRAKQIRETFQNINKETSNQPIIMMGDFNYPYGRKRFESLIQKYQFSEGTKNILYTLESKILKLIPIRMKLDYILYRNLKLSGTKRIEKKYSDHFPITSKFTFNH